MPGVLNSMDETSNKPEFSRYIELCARQLAAAMKGARRESALLAEELIAAADLVNRISPADSEGTGGGAENAGAIARRQLRERVNGIVLRMQFADRLDQQIDNVRKNLLLLAAYAETQRGRESESAWTELLQRSRQSFTMEHERFIFDTVLGDARAAKNADRTCSYAVLFDDSDDHA